MIGNVKHGRSNNTITEADIGYFTDENMGWYMITLFTLKIINHDWVNLKYIMGYGVQII